MPYHHLLDIEWERTPYKWKEHYYDTPDGQELFKKIKIMARDSGLLGFFTSFSYAYNMKYVRNHKLGAIMVATRTLPFLMAAVPFPIVTHALIKMRGKSDHYNYMGAGFVSGALWSTAWNHNFYSGLIRATLFSLAMAFWYNHRIVEGHKLIADEFFLSPREEGPFYLKRVLDTGITQAKPGNWTRDPPPGN